MENYKAGDVVLIRSRAGEALPHVHVRLLKRHHKKKSTVETSKRTPQVYPEYFYWDAEMVYEKEVSLLKKRWSIPFSFPNDIETIVFEEDIIKKVRKNKKLTRRNSYNKTKKKKSRG